MQITSNLSFSTFICVSWPWASSTWAAALATSDLSRSRSRSNCSICSSFSFNAFYWSQATENGLQNTFKTHNHVNIIIIIMYIITSTVEPMITWPPCSHPEPPNKKPLNWHFQLSIFAPPLKNIVPVLSTFIGMCFFKRLFIRICLQLFLLFLQKPSPRHSLHSKRLKI